MSSEVDQVAGEQTRSGLAKPARPRMKHRSSSGMSMLAHGEPMVWLTGGALAACLLMIVGLLGAVLYFGMSTFVPLPIVQVELIDADPNDDQKRLVTGEITKEEVFDLSAESLLSEEYAVVNRVIEDTVKAIGDENIVANLPTLIENDSEFVRRDLVEAEEKLEYYNEWITTLERELEERIASATAGGRAIEARMAKIRASSDGEELEDYRASFQTFRGKRKALRAQLKGNEDAIAYFNGLTSNSENAATTRTGQPGEGSSEDEEEAETPDQPPSKLQPIFDAPRPAKVAAINALLREQAGMNGEKTVKARRRMFRTGNKSKEVNRPTFEWVADYQMVPGSEERPEWTIVAERMEYGRFYGVPRQFVLRHKRTIDTEEEDLASIIELFDMNLWRAGLDDEKNGEVLNSLEPLREELKSLRKKTIDEFFNGFSVTDNKSIEIVDEGGTVVPLANRDEAKNYVELREVWSTPEIAWAKFEQYHDEVRERLAERYSLKEHELGMVSKRRNDALKELRREELKIDAKLAPIYREKQILEDEMIALEKVGVSSDSDAYQKLSKRFDELTVEAQAIARQSVNLRGLAHDIKQYDDQIEIIDGLIRENDQLGKMAAKRFGEDSVAAGAALEIVKKLNEEKQIERKPPADKVAELRADLEKAPDYVAPTVERFFEVQREADLEDREINENIARITKENSRYLLICDTTTSPAPVTLSLDNIVRAYPANQIDKAEAVGVYGSRWWEFISDDPREANSEGGVLPAIWGTVIMTLIMSIAVAPFGVLAALYLREYAKAGVIVSVIRISISNLAGVPSIVFGVFGLGFFCTGVGSYIDGGPENASWPVLSEGRWFVILAVLAVVSCIAFTLSLSGRVRPGAHATATKRLLQNVSTFVWIAAVCIFAALIVMAPFFRGFYQADLPNPTFGKGGVLWASLTLALLTLPVVIVATEEALAAVPNSMREGSYGCGASKWQTIRNIVLPHALPGIMTGMILAMARGAGEVAPLMLVGAVKLAPELPIALADFSGSVGPIPTGPLHADRSFMHLGFHIYDLGFQSQDSEAARPMVFTTTLLLILIIAALNIGAIWLRNKLRKRFQSGQF